MIPAIAYIRVSTKDQSDHGYSIPGQMADILSYAQRNKLELVSIYTEDESGFIIDRPELAKARTDLKTGKAKAIICHEDTRLSREPVHSVILRDEFSKLGIQLHYALRGEINLQDYMHQAFEDIRARQAKEEVAKLVERSRRGKRTKVAQGNVIVAQRPPYGYAVKDGKLIVIDHEARIVRQIFTWYTIDGFSIRRIADTLTSLLIPTPADSNEKMSKRRPAGYWAKSFVANILKRETYAGVWYWGKTQREYYQDENGKRRIRMTAAPRENWIAVDVPAIISRDTFDAAQERFGYNIKMAKRAMKRDYLMSKRLICQCGLPCYAEARSSAGKKTMYYFCSSKHLGTTTKNCGAPYFPALQVDDLAWGYLKNLLNNPDLLTELINAHLTDQPNKQAGIKSEIDSLIAEIAKLESGKVKLMKRFALEDDKAADQALAELKAEIAEKRQQAETLRARLVNTPQDDDLVRLANAVRTYQDVMTLENEPFQVKAGWVEAFNLRGKVWKDGKQKKVTFTWDFGQLEMSLGTQLPRSYGHSLELNYTVDLNSIVRSRQLI